MGSRASLNHIYRTVWNQALGAMVAVAEVATGRGKSGTAVAADAGQAQRLQSSVLRVGVSAFAVACAWGSVATLAQANPTGGTAIHGQATQSGSANQLLVTTQNGAGTKHSAINWQSFSIPAGSSTYFQQPDGASTVINRVVTNTPSLIFGTLGSNGNVVLVNQSGITVGAGALVDTAGFTASALRMADADAIAGRLRFGDGAVSAGGVSVQGSILARTGDVVLVGANVEAGQSALVQAPNGSTVLAAGQQIAITGRGLEGISLLVQAPTDAAVNLGTLNGDAVGIFAGTLKTAGAVAATAVTAEGGRVFLKAADTAEISGTVSARALNGLGGTVHASADKVVLKAGAAVDVSGHNGGGEALIGGGYQGQDARLANARRTLVEAGATITADATGAGDGGTVVVWSDEATRYLGHASARGGAAGGDGGLVEVSGKQYLDFRGTADLRADAGQQGTLLLDPLNLTIGALADVTGLNGGYGTDITGDILLADFVGQNSQITAGQLSTRLGYGAVVLQATNDIFVNQGITGSNNLNLTAGNAIHVDANIDLGTAALGLSAGAGGISGDGIITANVLNIVSSGDVVLNAPNAGDPPNAGNVVQLLFATLTGTASLDFVNKNLLVVGTINAEDSRIYLESYNGGINLAGQVVAGSPGGDNGLTLVAGGGSVNQNNSGAFIKAMELDASGVNVNLGAASNEVGLLALAADPTTGAATFKNNGAVELGNISGAAFTLDTSSANGAVTQNGGSTIDVLAASFNAGTGDITLDRSGNSFGQLAVASAGAVEVQSQDASLDVAAMSVRSFDLSTSGAINLNGNLTATGGDIFVETTDGAINLGSGPRTLQATNNLNLVGFVTGSNSLTLSAGGLVGIDGDINLGSAALTLAAGGGVQGYSGVITAGDLSITAGAAVALNDSGNAGHRVNTLTATLAGNAALDFKNEDTLDVGAITTDLGDIRIVTTDGDINLTGTVTAGVRGAGNLVTLDASGFFGAVITQTSNARIRTTQLSATASGVRLGTALNEVDQVDLSADTVVDAGYGELVFRNSGALLLGAVTGYDLDMDTSVGNGAISQLTGYGSPVNVAYASFNAGSGAITLANTSNALESVNIASAGDVLLRASAGLSALNLNGINARSLDLRTGGNIYVQGDVVASTGNVSIETTNGFMDMVPDGTAAITAPGSITLKATDGLLLGDVTSGAAGDAVVLVSHTIGPATYGFDASQGSITLSGGGRWLVYVGPDDCDCTVPTSNYGSLNASFKQYNAQYGDVVLGTGSGVLSQSQGRIQNTTLFGSATKVYDGQLGISFSGLSIGDPALMPLVPPETNRIDDDLANAVLVSATAVLDDANVGTAKDVSVTSAVYSGVAGPEGSNMTVYYGASGVVGAVGAVTPAPLTAVGAATKVFNGLDTVEAGFYTLSGLVNGETLQLDSQTFGQMVDKNAGVNKVVDVSGLGLVNDTGLASNYQLVGATPLTITPVASVTWTGATNNLWSEYANWSGLLAPDGANFSAIVIPSGASVVYDASAGATTVQTLVTTGLFTMAGGSLSVGGSFTAPQFAQNSGTVSGAGAFTVTDSFNQTGGAIAMTGPVSITQASGDLTVGSVSGGSVSLEATTGSILQTAAIGATGLLKTLSVGSTTLDNPANSVAGFDATISGAGDVSFTNVGVLDVSGVVIPNGDLTIDNTGGLLTSGAIAVPNGAVSITTHSPMVIGSTINAGGSILLAALTPDGSSNITVNGAMTSTAGGISVQAYNNFIQNSNLSAAFAIDITAGGTLTFGPSAFSVGNPVSYTVNGVTYAPPWVASTLSGGPTSFVDDFLGQFETALASQDFDVDDPLGLRERDKEGVVVEGEICAR